MPLCKIQNQCFNCLLIHTPNLSQNSDGTLFSEVNFCAYGAFSLAGEIKGRV